ncbi:hypothetical protein ABT56_17805 [Photobacterium aquae]|uniref:Lipoprotein n=1 Tax=Photobacterium aquae TaxID=1195763 RepID=A0A0J1GVX1_9GAMM|nr:hypothetical protein [Photobacterium aquae]KLV03825.1 hypothetical protein ABT56_17805 [Photobacterium aquae]
MHINKITILLSLLLMSGCLERNLEYYEANLDEARVKVEQCETSAIKAFTTQDKERVEAVLTDTECLSAVEAVKAHDQKIAELEREKAQKEHEAQKKAAEKKYHEDYAKYSVSLSDLSYIEIDKLNKECRFSVRDKAKCQAVKELNEKKKNEEINVLKDKYVGGKLEEYRKSSCKGGIEFNHVICNIAKEAENQQQNKKK